MKIKYNILAGTFATALLVACGGGGSNSLKNSNIPLVTEPFEFDSEIRHTIDKQGNLSYFSALRIEPNNNTVQTERHYVDLEFQPPRKLNSNNANVPGYSGAAVDRVVGIEDDPREVEIRENQFDWYHEKTFTRDLIRFADTEDNLVDDSNMADFPGVTVYSQSIPVSLNGDSLSLSIFGLRNIRDGEAFVLFDQYAGIVSGGSIFNGTPTGNQTYKGYNLFRYTPNSEKSSELQSGTFEMEVDFSTGTGTIQANSMSSIPESDDTEVYSGTKLGGNVIIDAENGTFAGRNLKFTEISLRENAREVGLKQFEETEGGIAKIQGLFHGTDGQGVSGIYQHNVEENGEFRGGIVGGQNFELNGSPFELPNQKTCLDNLKCQGI